MPLVKLETRKGQAVWHRDTELIPQARVLMVNLPGRRGVFIWNRPAGLEVKNAGASHYLPVRDKTWTTVSTMLFGTGALLAVLATFKRRSLNKESSS